MVGIGKLPIRSPCINVHFKNRLSEECDIDFGGIRHSRFVDYAVSYSLIRIWLVIAINDGPNLGLKALYLLIGSSIYNHDLLDEGAQDFAFD